MTKSKNLVAESDTSVDLELDTYRPPKDKRQDIVDVVCRIMDDDGPRPMRDMRPTQKHRNAAEQFHSDHHDAYEARGRPSRDRMEAVHLHNSAYPKMHDELNKKRSTTRVTAIPTQRVATVQQKNYNRFNNCMKNRKKAQPKKRTLAPRYRAYDAKARNARQNTSRITKPKSKNIRRRSPCKIYKLSKIRTNKGCQCSSFFVARDKMSGTDKTLFVADEKMAIEEGPFPCRDLNQVASDPHKHQQQQQHSCNASQCSKEGSSCHKRPDTDGSVSSYDSYASLEHEPMVSK